MTLLKDPENFASLKYLCCYTHFVLKVNKCKNDVGTCTLLRYMELNADFRIRRRFFENLLISAISKISD